MIQSPNTVWHHATVTRERREAQNGHKSCLLWFTGLSGAGKSTLAHAVEEHLHQLGCRTFVWHGLHWFAHGGRVGRSGPRSRALQQSLQ